MSLCDYSSEKPLNDRDMHWLFEFEDIKSPQQNWIKINKVTSALPKIVIFPSHVDGKRLMLPDSCDYLFCPHLNQNNEYAKGYYFNRDCEYIDFSGIINISNVKSMKNMFSDGYLLQQINFGSNFNSYNVTNMDYMFAMCPNLIEVDTNNLKTNKVTTMEGMFFGCKAIESLDVSGFITSSVTNMSRMFFNCNSVKKLDVSGFTTTNVINMHHMFYGCKSIKYLDVSRFMTYRVIDMSFMFYDCCTLHNISMFMDTENCTNMQYMFYNCDALESLDLGRFCTTNVQTFKHMFHGCGGLRKLNISSFNFKNLNKISEDDIDNKFGLDKMFLGCEFINNISLPKFNSVPNVERCDDLSVLTLIGDTDNEYLKSELQNCIDIAKRIKNKTNVNTRALNQRTVSRSASRTSQRALNNRNINYQVNKVSDVLSDKELIRYFNFEKKDYYSDKIYIYFKC